jgi:hypothetical protein
MVAQWHEIPDATISLCHHLGDPEARNLAL